MFNETVFRIMVERQTHLDSLNLAGRERQAAMRVLVEEYPDYVVVTRTGSALFEAEAKPKRITIWLDDADMVKAVVHG